MSSEPQVVEPDGVQAPEEQTEPPVSRQPLRPIPHAGPLQADPAMYDCGQIPLLAVCEFESHLRNTGLEPLVIDRIAQDFSPWASIGLVEDSTGFDRTLPYTMEPGEPLRLLFHYRHRQNQEEQPSEGSVFVRYTHADRRYEIEIPVAATP